MGGVTKSDFEWRFIFEKSALNFEFQTRLFVFSVHPAWSFNLELLCILVCFCGVFWCGVMVHFAFFVGCVDDFCQFSTAKIRISPIFKKKNRRSRVSQLRPNSGPLSKWIRTRYPLRKTANSGPPPSWHFQALSACKFWYIFRLSLLHAFFRLFFLI